MQKIYKYPILIEDNQIIILPNGFKPLCIQIQLGQPYMWAIVNPELTMVKAEIKLFGTGHNLIDLKDFEYLGSFQMMAGTLVYHAFIK